MPDHWKAVTGYRDLAATNPAAFTLDLATSLNNQAQPTLPGRRPGPAWPVT